MSDRTRTGAAGRGLAMRPTQLALNLAIAALLVIAPAAFANETNPAQPTDGAQGVNPEGQVEAANVRPKVSGRLSDRQSVRGDGVRLRGIVSRSSRGKTAVRMYVRKAGSRGWKRVAGKRVKRGVKFSLRWRGRTPGRYIVRLTATQNGKRDSDRLGGAYVYRRSHASWYGPGFYGNRTACGGRLTRSVVGVAHRSLPCGKRVTFHLNGRTVTARVIDRGPFVSGREWDLSPALKRKLRFGSTGVVNATS